MKNFICVLLLGLSLSGFSQTDYISIYDSEAIIAQGTKFHNEKKYAEAIKEYDKIDRIDPFYPTAQYEKALTYKAMKEPEKAREIYEKAYMDGYMEERADLCMAYGAFLSDAKEYDKAETMLLQGEKLNPNSGPMLYNLALLYLRKTERQKSIDILKKSITINPNHAGSHYLLGSIALEEGHVTEGAMALLTYLILNPSGGGAEQCIIKLNSKFGENYLERSNLVLSETGDNFAEIDEILRNQLPLRDAYKVKSDFSDVIIRQIQAIVEYAADHKIGNGFFEKNYIPYLAEIARKDRFEGMSYYILISMEEKLGKKFTSNKKKIVTFQEEFIYTDFWELFAKRKLDMFGKEQEVVIYLDDSGNSTLMGSKVNDKKEGKFKSVNSDGNIAAELNFTNDRLEGIQKYFDRKGQLYEEKSFSSGKLEGKRTTFYPNGNLKVVEMYKNDLLDGLSTSYYPNGGKACEVSFTEGERNGSMICLYENGTRKSDLTYVKGKLDGTVKYFNELGTITSETPYKMHEIDGKFVEFYDGKTIKSEAEYTNGKIKAYYKTYYPHGSPNAEYMYNNGTLKKSVNYSENGKKSVETLYDAKGNVENYSYYNNNGDKFYEEIFKGGEIKTGLQYKPGIAKPVETDISRKGEDLKNYEGVTIALGKYEKSKRAGDWLYYYDTGVQKEKETFVNGVKTGLDYSYDSNGKLVSIVNYANDTISGLYESYHGGKLVGKSHYRLGEKNGASRSFYTDGTTSTASFYEQGIIVSNNTYWQNGNIATHTTYTDGAALTMETYLPDGKKENTINYTNKNGKMMINFYNGHIVHDYYMVNGVFNGKYLVKDKSGKIVVDAEYLNGNKHNRYLRNGPLGNPNVDLNYDNGQLHGLNKYYDFAGNLRLTIEYLFGDQTGKTTRYYQNKVPMYESKQLNGKAEGEAKYYNLSGEPILAIGYQNDEIKYYIPLDKAGKLTDKVIVADQTVHMVSTYPNGKTAMELRFNKGITDGKLSIYSHDGKPAYEISYAMGQIEGVRTEYYASGKVYKKETFVNDSYEGPSEYFKEDGKPLLVVGLKSDELHGLCKIYTEGGVVTKLYDSDELVEIK